MTRSIHRDAETELTEAFRFYQQEAGKRVAARFLDEFERLVKLLEAHPGFGTPTADGRRSFAMTNFPYSVIYRDEKSGIRVLVVRHQHRDPEHGAGRR